MATQGLITSITQLSTLQERDPIAMEFILGKIYTCFVLTIIYQLVHCSRPYNAYNDAIIGEFIENFKFELTQVRAPSGGPASNPTLRHQAVVQKEPFSTLLIKLLLRSRTDLLRRVHSVLERDNETLLRLGEEQEREIDRVRRICEDLFMRMGHMEKLLQLRTVQLIELRQRLDSMQFVSADGTFVWNIDQVVS